MGNPNFSNPDPRPELDPLARPINLEDVAHIQNYLATVQSKSADHNVDFLPSTEGLYTEFTTSLQPESEPQPTAGVFDEAASTLARAWWAKRRLHWANYKMCQGPSRRYQIFAQKIPSCLRIPRYHFREHKAPKESFLYMYRPGAS